MGGAYPSGRYCALLGLGRRIVQHGHRPSLITYSLTTGVFAMTGGAAASLAMTAETSRIAAWCAATLALATLAGFAYESPLADAWWRASHRWLSRFGRF